MLLRAPFCLALLFSCLALVFATAAHSQTSQAAPPPARIDNVTDEHFGVKITDPYRWLEDMTSPEVQQWMKSQATYAEAKLKSLPMRDDIFKRLNELDGTSVAVNNIQQRGKHVFYNKRNIGEQDFKLYVRDGLAGAERMLVDPNRILADGKRHSLGAWTISHDVRYLSYNMSAGGSEQAQLRVVEVATGKDMGERIDRTNFGAGQWLPDGKSFMYPRFPETAPNAPAAEKYQKIRVYLHRLGTDPKDDRPVFGYGLNADIKDGIDMLWNVETRPEWDFVLARIYTGVSPEREFFIAPLSALDKSPVPWRRIVSFNDQVLAADIRGDELYLLTYKNTPRYKIVRTSLSKPDIANAKVVFPAGASVLTSLTAQRDALYVNALDGGNYRIHRVDYATLKAEPLPLPYQGAANLAGTETGTDGIHFNLVSWTKSRTHFKYDPALRKAVPTGLIPPSPIDMSSYEFINASAKSHDGTQVPLVIIYKKGMERNGRNPTLMEGYGAYGIESTSPFFNPQSLAWLERGGVHVWTGIRGGGEYGDEWHRAGFQKTKPNTWKDFIACAEYLIAEKITSPAYLAITGASAGGILLNNMLAERPDLFGAAIVHVGMSNMMRYETTSNGLPNVPEFGSFKTEEGFKALLAMDGYLKIRDNMKLPAVLLTHGVNDARVDVWFSTKMTARLQAASISGKPVLLRLDYDSGHGSGATRAQRNAEAADVYAFLFSQLGDAAGK